MADDPPTRSAEYLAETQAPTLYGLTISFFTISTVSVVLRMYTRKKLLRFVGTDDIAIIVAQILSLGVTATTIYQTAKGGLGRHVETLTGAEIREGYKGLMSNVLVYNAAQIFTKVSFLIQYRRLFPSDTIQAICKYGLFFLGIWGFAQVFITAFACDPLTQLNPALKGHCITTKIVFTLNGSMNIATDFAIFAIPIWPVVQLHMPLRRKLNLLGVFCLGFFACVVSIVRLIQVTDSASQPDGSWANAKTAYWSAIELNVGVLCACLPTLRPLLKKYVPFLLGSSTGATTADTHKLAYLSSRRKTMEPENKSGIYLQRTVDVQSTTELRSSSEAPGEGCSSRGDSTDAIVIEGGKA